MSLALLFSSKRRTILITASIAVKAVLMTLTPMSLELTYLMPRITYPSKWDLTPYGKFMELIFRGWQAIPVDHPTLSTSWTVEAFHGSTGLYLLVFMIKLPLLVLDIITGMLLYQTILAQGLGEKKARFGFFLWFLNPYVFLVNEMWGTIDLIPTLLILLTIFYLHEKNTLRGAAAFGAAVAAKLFPILLLPVFLSIGRKSKFTLLLASGLIGLAGYVAWASYAGFDVRLQLHQYDPFTQYFDEYTIMTSSGGVIGLATVALVVTYVFLAEKWPRNRKQLYEPMLIVFLAFFAFGNWFPQYLIWMIPLLILDGVASGKGRLTLVFVLISSALFLAIFAFYPYFTANGQAFFLVPANTLVLKQAVAAYEWFAGDNFIVTLAAPAARAIFTVTCLIYSLKIAQKHTGVISSLLGLLRGRIERPRIEHLH